MQSDERSETQEQNGSSLWLEIEERINNRVNGIEPTANDPFEETYERIVDNIIANFNFYVAIKRLEKLFEDVS